MGKYITCKRSVQIGLGSGKVLILRPETRVIDEAHLNHFYVKAMIVDGDLIIKGDVDEFGRAKAEKIEVSSEATLKDDRVAVLNALPYQDLIKLAVEKGFDAKNGDKKKDIISAIIEDEFKGA